MIDYATLLTLAEWHQKLSTFALPLSNIPRKAGHSKVEATEAGFLGNISAYRRGMEVKTESDIKQDIHNNLLSYRFEMKCKAKREKQPSQQLVQTRGGRIHQLRQRGIFYKIGKK